MKWGNREDREYRAEVVSRTRRAEGKSYHAAEIWFPRAGEVWPEP